MEHWTHPTTPVYLGYARASTKEQDLESQEAYLRKRAAELGLPCKIWSEKKTSKDYNRLISDIIKVIRPGDIVGLWMTDRIARPDPGDEWIVFAWAQQIRQAGGTLEMGGTRFDSSNPADFINLYFKLRSAGETWDIIRKNTARGRGLARSSGNFVGGGDLLPLGYRRAVGERPKAEGGTKAGFVPEHDPQWVPVVREIFAHAAKNRSLNSLAKDFDARGLKPLKAQKWNRATLFRIIHNPVYMGYVLADPKKDRNQLIKKLDLEDMTQFLPAHHYPPIVTVGEWWDAIRGFRATGTVRHGVVTYRPSRNDAVYSGITKCWYCVHHGYREGITLTKSFSRATTLTYRLPHRAPGCISYRGIGEVTYHYLINIACLFALIDLWETDDFIRSELERLRDPNQDTRKDDLLRDLGAKTKKKQEWTDLILTSGADELELVKKYRSIIKDIDREIDRINDELRVINLGTQLAEIDSIKTSFSTQTLRVINNGNDDDRKQALRGILKDSWMFKQTMNFRFKNSKVVWYRLPLKGKGRTPISRNVYEFGVSYRGNKQMTGWIDFDRGQWHVEASKFVPESIREGVSLPDLGNQIRGLERV